jgi:hypothetical protein
LGATVADLLGVAWANGSMPGTSFADRISGQDPTGPAGPTGAAGPNTEARDG